jgi:hypothetical protein
MLYSNDKLSSTESVFVMPYNCYNGRDKTARNKKRYLPVLTKYIRATNSNDLGFVIS